MSESESSSSSSSSSGSSSESGTDYEDMNEVLSSIGLRRKYGRMFAKASIEDLDDAKDLSEKKLKSLGIVSSSDRKKIMRAIENATTSDSESSSESDSDDVEAAELERLERTLKANGLKKYLKPLKSSKIYSVGDLSKLDESKLKKMGVSSSEDKKKLLKLAKKSSSVKKGSEVVKYLRRDNSLKKYTDVITKEGKVTTLSQAKRLSDRQLRKLGIKSAKHREKIIKTFSKAKASARVSSSNEVNRILSKAKLKEYAKTFAKYDIDTLERALELSTAELKRMGVDTVADRHNLVKAFKKENKKRSASDTSESSDDSSDNEGEGSESALENEPIYKVLKGIKLEKFTERFTSRDLVSVRSAQALGHNELRDLGFEAKGQRDLIIEAFQDADWKCVYCKEWNEFRTTCGNCHKKRRNIDEDAKFSLDQRVKYVGKFRPTTRVKHGDKGEIHRVLSDKHYMVRLKKGDTICKIRLREDELAAL